MCFKKKLQLKKYIYLINDITNKMLSKDRQEARELLDKWRILAFALMLLLIISIIFNIIQLYN